MDIEVKLNKLKGLIAEHDLAHYEVAELLSIASNTFSRKMNKKADFSLSEAKKLADFFNMSIDELFFYSEVAKLEQKGRNQNQPEEVRVVSESRELTKKEKKAQKEAKDNRQLANQVANEILDVLVSHDLTVAHAESILRSVSHEISKISKVQPGKIEIK